MRVDEHVIYIGMFTLSCAKVLKYVNLDDEMKYNNRSLRISTN